MARPDVIGDWSFETPSPAHACGGFLEVETPGRGMRNDRYGEAFTALRQASIRGRRVLDVIDEGGEPTPIPHFGWDFRCAAGACAHGGDPDHPANRYFGIRIVLEGGHDPDIYGTYDLIDGHARLTISTSGSAVWTRPRTELRPLGQ